MRVAFVGALLILLAGCTHEPPARPVQAAAAPGYPVTLRDDSGRELTFAGPPQRIVSLSPAHTETLYALGVGDRVVATDSYSDYPPEVKPKATLECWPQVPVEPLVALRPDLVVVLTQESDFIRQMEGASVPVLKLFPKTYQGVLDGILALGRIVGAEGKAREITTSMEARTRAVEMRVKGKERPTFVYEMDVADPQRPYVAGSGGFYGELFALAGGRNVFSELQAPSGQVSAEQVIARDPAVILLGDAQVPHYPQTPELVLRRPGWESVDAVRNRRVYAVDDQQITRPGPRLVDGLEEIARLFHGEAPGAP